MVPAYIDAYKTLLRNKIKELIKVRDFQVAPPELEGVLLNHPEINDCVVIGIKGPPNSDTEFPHAYVIRRHGTQITAAEVKSLVSAHLASYKQLTGSVRFVDEIPKSASGKILKKDLRAEADNERVTQKQKVREYSKL